MKKILDRINSPDDLKKIKFEELETLAGELREVIIDTTFNNGGHLASNLGAIELTIAIHRVFNSPLDKIIWDVGHQSYTHKLLTGRKKVFSTIRQIGGISGFPCRFESEHDAFTAGHAGNSISSAVGMAMARDFSGHDYNVIAVIGDGSLGAGMALEAINHAGVIGSKLIIILNDNGMSISKSVGALCHALNTVRFDPTYEKLKKHIKKKIFTFSYGKFLWEYLKKIKSKFLSVLVPSSFWENLGFNYLGPVDGHDIKELELAFFRAREYESEPVVIHVVTKKGKGINEFENNASKYHGVSPKKKEKSDLPSFSNVFSKSLISLMKENEKIVAITAAMLDGTGLSSVAKIFPQRVIDVGICEQHAVTMAAGLASRGYIPIVAIYSTFLQRAYDQIVHDVALQDLPVIFAVDRAGVVGDDGKTHHGVFDILFMRSIPNMIVSSPGNLKELGDLLKSAVEYGKPFSIRYPRGTVKGHLPDGNFQIINPGKSQLVKDGDDLVIFSLGNMLSEAMHASEVLSSLNIDCAVVNIRFVKPLDSELILYMAMKTGRVITIEENVFHGGFGSAVNELLVSKKKNNIKIENIAFPDDFIEHGTQDYLRQKCGVNSAGIINCVKNVFPEILLNKNEENFDEHSGRISASC